MAPLLIAALILCASALYATAGQAGGTAFLAIMAFAAVPPADMRPTSLALNLVAAGYATARLHRADAIAWPLLRRLGLPALPAAFLGGLIVLGGRLYLALTGALLLAAAALMLLRRDADRTTDEAPTLIGVLPALIAGSGTGFVSGLTGIGGGVFLAPLLIALGWASPRRAARLSAPFILADSALGLAGVLVAGQHQLAPSTPFYAAAALAGAALGTAIGLRWMSQRATRRVLALILAVAGVRLLLR